MQPLEERRLLATYYVDGIGGDDTQAGTSAEAAWASLARVEQTVLSPGDQIWLRRGSVWNDTLTLDDAGTASEPIVVTAYGEGDLPVFRRLTVDAGNIRFENLIVDRNRQSGDAVRVRYAHDVVFRNMVVRNGTSDGIDATDADGLLIDGLKIHHFLAGSFDIQKDAHGVVVSDTQGMTIRNTEIHHVSGDSFQADPDRDRETSTDLVLEQSHFWTSPLEEDFNGSWFAGERPGENAIDTKVVKSDWETVERMKITVRDVVAHGWVADGYINNRAAFNMKEKIEATFEGVTVYDSEIGFRLRGSRGNANVTIQNAVLHDLDKAIRAEDDLANLSVFHSTFGAGIDRTIQFAGGDGGRGTWDFRNNAFLGSLPGPASDPSNRSAEVADFADVSANDYHLAATSDLIDAGVAIASVSEDREGTSRPQGEASDVGAYERVTAAPPRVEDVMINGGADTRSSVTDVTVTFDQIVDVDLAGGETFRFVNTDTGEDAVESAAIEQAAGKTVVRFRFQPGDTVTAGGSLADGDYELRIDASGVTAAGLSLDGNGNGDPGGEFVFGDREADRFYRKYGDEDGNGIVDLLDFAAFRRGFGAVTTSDRYNESLDNDGDGIIDLLDFAAFRTNFGA